MLRICLGLKISLFLDRLVVAALGVTKVDVLFKDVGLVWILLATELTIIGFWIINQNFASDYEENWTIEEVFILVLCIGNV